MSNIVILIGKSASGKSTIEKELNKHFGFERCVSCTTRPPRKGEVDGIDYYFLTDENFEEMKKDGMFLESAKYREWNYGVTVDEVVGKEKAVLIVESHGLAQILADKRIDPFVVYVDTEDRIRYIRQLYRGDDIIEVALRSERDKACFQGVAEKADLVVSNNEWSSDESNPYEVAKLIDEAFTKQK